MSYCHIYRIIPKHSWRILRKCAGCGIKMSYESTDCFRVNANGRMLDVWLIYQCPKCRHTYNLPIYERVKPESLDVEEYQRFLRNDADLAMEYAMSKRILGRSKAEIDYESMEYDTIHVSAQEHTGDADSMKIENPYEIKIRLERVLAEITGISRSKINKHIKTGKIIVNEYLENDKKVVSVKLDL